MIRGLRIAGFVLSAFWLGMAALIVVTGEVSVASGAMMAGIIALGCFLMAMSAR